MLMSFRAEEILTAETKLAAKLAGCSRSEYLRRAVGAQNKLMLEKRMVYLSQSLDNENEAFEGTIKDGLDDEG